MFSFVKKIPSCTPQEAATKIADPAVGFIDVRTKREYREGHAKGAINFPLDELPEGAMQLRKFAEIYVICRSGGRSERAARYLLTEQFRVINVSGGTLAWQSVGLPMEN